MALRLIARPREIDFPLLIRRIEDSGHRRWEIAAAINCQHSDQVYRWASGQYRPGFENGRALCLLFEELFGTTPPSRPWGR